MEAESAPGPGAPAVPASGRAVPWPAFAAAGVAVAAAAVQLAYLRRGGFFLDDFRNLGEARHGLSLRFVFSPIGKEHLEPFSRFLAWVVAVPLHRNYGLAAGLLAVTTGAGTFFLIRLLDELFGERWLHRVAGFLFGTSWIFLATNQWFEGAHSVPAAALFLASSALWVRWLRRGEQWRYAMSLICGSLAVLTWEQALLIPGWLLLLWACFARPDATWKRVLVSLVPFAAVCAAFTLYVQQQPWQQPLEHPTLAQWLKLASVMLFHAVLPAMVGTGLPNGAAGSRGRTSLAIAAAVLVVALLWLGARRRLRWSGVAFLLVAIALVVTTVATTRLDVGIDATGNTPRYLVFLVVAVAVGLVGLVGPHPARPAHSSGSAHSSRSGTWVPLAGVVAAAVAASLYLWNLNTTFHHITFGRAMGLAAARESKRIDLGLAQLGTDGARLVDSQTPFPIWYAAPGGDLAALGAFWRPGLTPVGEGQDLVSFDPTGTLRSAAFRPGVNGGGYVRVVVSAVQRSTFVVTIRTSQGGAPWHIVAGPGTQSFVVPTWTNAPVAVDVQPGPGVTILSQEQGSLVLGPPVPVAGAPAAAK